MAWMETFVLNASPGENRIASGVSIRTVTPRTCETSGALGQDLGGAGGGGSRGVPLAGVPARLSSSPSSLSSSS
uniref:ORF_09R n=1 Tax=Human herpesvirus 1 (strain R15) TaxID=36345 RepID=Q6VB54_HHV1R|nr:ORF_09R [Human alphaherpesvirus 1 strain R-15]